MTSSAPYDLGGCFRLDPKARVLLRNNEPLPLGERAVAVLLLLVAAPGQLVTKDALMTGAWNGLAVEESNLTVQVAALRKALATAPGGTTWIETLPRRGYRFTGPVSRASPALPAVEAIGVPRIAILPFRAGGHVRQPCPFADSLMEDIASVLSGMREITILSPGLTLGFDSADPREAGRRLACRYVLSGAVRHRAAQVRVTAELADADSGALLWSHGFEADPDALDLLAAQIGNRVMPRIQDAELRRLRGQDRPAYPFLVRARDALYRLDREGSDAAWQLTQRALDIDPSDASGHLLAAEWHSLRVGQGWSDDPVLNAAAIERHANLALRADGANARALAFLGHNKSWLARDYAAAQALYNTATETGPGNAAVWGWSSATYAYLGQYETAIRRAGRALALAPEDPVAFIYQHFLSIGYYLAGNYQAALDWARRTMRTAPDYTSNLRIAAASLAALGDRESARDVGRRLITLDPGFRVSAMVARLPFQDAEQRARMGEQLTWAGLSR